MMKQKKYRIDMRLSEPIMRQFLAICAVKQKNRTAVFEDLIREEYGKNSLYQEEYFKNGKNFG